MNINIILARFHLHSIAHWNDDRVKANYVFRGVKMSPPPHPSFRSEIAAKASYERVKIFIFILWVSNLQHACFHIPITILRTMLFAFMPCNRCGLFDGGALAESGSCNIVLYLLLKKFQKRQTSSLKVSEFSVESSALETIPSDL